MKRPLAVVVLAAGQGTRMKSARPKMLHEAAGRPILEHVLRAALELEPEKVVVVVGHGASEVRRKLGSYPVTFVVQREQLGTGHALLQAEPELSDFGGELMVLNGDMPLLTPATLRALARRRQETGAVMAMVTCEVEEPTGLGRIVRREDGSVAAIVEEKDATPEQKRLREINPGAYLFGPDVFERSHGLGNQNAQGEYYITDLVDVYIRSGLKVQAVAAEGELSLLVGVNDRRQLAAADRILRDRIRGRWLDAGVSMVSPEQTFIDDTVTLAQDVVLGPGVVLAGATEVGRGASIGPYSCLSDCRVEPGASVPPHTVRRGGRLS